jgi:hypothetical protein
MRCSLRGQPWPEEVREREVKREESREEIGEEGL